MNLRAERITRRDARMFGGPAHTLIPVLTDRAVDRYLQCPVEEEYLINQRCNVFAVSDAPRHAACLSNRDIASRSRWYPIILMNAHARLSTVNITTAFWKDHPWVVWTAMNASNYRWMQYVTFAVWDTYFSVYGHISEAERRIGRKDLRLPWNILHRDEGRWEDATTPPVVLPEEFRPVGTLPTWENTVEAYRRWYVMTREHRDTHRWINKEPDWFIERVMWADGEDAASRLPKPEPVSHVRRIKTIA